MNMWTEPLPGGNMPYARETGTGLGQIFRDQMDLQPEGISELASLAWLEDEAHRLFVYGMESPSEALGALTVIVATLVKRCQNLERNGR